MFYGPVCGILVSLLLCDYRSMSSSSGRVASTPNNAQTQNQTVLVICHSFVKRLLTSAIAAGTRNVGLDYAVSQLHMYFTWCQG